MWATIGSAIGKGVLAWGAGTALDSVFGNDYTLKDAVSEIIAHVDQTVRKAIEDNELRDLEDKLDSLHWTFRDYMTNRKDRNLLTEAKVRAYEVVEELDSFGLAGHHGYMVAGGVAISIIQESFGVNKPRNVKQLEHLRDYIDKLIAHAETMHTLWRTYHEQRYTIQKFEELGFVAYSVYRDGRLWTPPYKSRAGFETWTEANKERARILEKDWREQMYPDNVKGSEEIVVLWKKLRVDITWDANPSDPIPPTRVPK